MIKKITNKIKVIDAVLKNNLAENKKKAEALILEGRVFANGVRIEKAGTFISENSDIFLKSPPIYVSRGAYKLESAFKSFSIDLSCKKAIDFGASTGGFTDYLLKSGAEKVIAIDVGYGQFDWKLRNNKNVFLFERTNIKSLSVEQLPFLAQFAAADLSFISIKNIFKYIYNLTSDSCEILLLIKPQFELEKELVENKGVIIDENLHILVLKDIIYFFEKEINIEILGLDFSRIKGAKGNIEFWIYLKKIKENAPVKKEQNYDKIITDLILKTQNYFKKHNL